MNKQTFNEKLEIRLHQACGKFSCSRENLLVGTLALLLARFAGSDEVVFRSGAEKDSLAVTAGQPIGDFMESAHKQMERWLTGGSGAVSEFAALYDFKNIPEIIVAPGEIGSSGFVLRCKTEPFAMSAEAGEGEYADELAESLPGAFYHVLGQLSPKKNIDDLDWVTGEELERLKNIHDTKWPVKERPAYRLLQDSAEKFPDRTAVIANGKAMTYAQLNRAANRVAHVLREHGAGVESVVGIVLHRGLEVYMARQGALKSGGAFLAMTPDYPDERIRFIMEDAKARHLITTRDIYEERKDFFEGLDVFICLIEDTQGEEIPPANLDVEVPPDALAYCIYTSGSTGKPKGVMLTNHNLVYFVDANPRNHEILGYTERGSISLALAAITFDVSIMEEFIPLAHGLTICMANEEEIHNPLLLKELCDRNRVDLMICTPSYLANLIDFPEFASVVRRLKSVDIGAEAFPAALFSKLRAVNPELYIMNGYGPTETTISCTMKPVESAENITIGIPNSNVKVVMTDEKNRPLPVGALGEMTILGDGVGRGYVNRPELTEKSFIRLWGSPAYKSGDLARLLPNGEIEFHGRRDNQVKLHGLRIELGEIETVLNDFPGVKSSIVVVKQNSAGDYLAGYFTAEKPIDLAALKKHLAASLTAYMVPGVLMQLDEFPLTASRKIDKKALPEPDEKALTQEGSRKTAATDLQRTLCGMFAKALGRESVGPEENFFEIGGTSMAASKVAMGAYLQQLPIVYADIFKYPTAEELEAYILSGEPSASMPAGEQKPSRQDTIPPQSSVQTFLNELFQIEHALAKNRVEYVDEIRKGDLGDVAVTGATGFLGIHIVYELLKHTRSRIFCFVRKRKEVSALEYLKSWFFYYFEIPVEDFDQRVTVVEGDITDTDAVDSLMEIPFQTLINCAACVKHFAADDILTRINVEGVRNLLELCIRKKARLIQISTISIAGDNVNGKLPEDARLSEHDFYIGQEVTSNKYVYSKFQAEELILAAVGQGILDAKIMRVGNLMSRASDGEFQMNHATNAFMRDLRSYAVLGKFPVSLMDETADFSPIDETARMIVALAGTSADFTVFHVVNSHRVHMGDVIQAMQEYGLDIAVVSDEEFQSALREAMADEDKNLLVSNLIAYNEEGNRSVEEVDHSDAFTVKALYRLGCRWSITDIPYMKKAVEALDTLGFFAKEIGL